ncbi:MAG: hypothetical protein RLY16_2913 [Bacteroidota bacterium]
MHKKYTISNSIVLRFIQQLQQLDINALGLEAYCAAYLRHLQAHVPYFVRIYASQLASACNAAQLPLQEIVWVDYGAGNGVMGLLAKFAGAKKVFINDINPVFMEAAEKLAVALQINIDGFIVGDETALVTYFKQQEIQPDALVSFDVIEHVYRLEPMLALFRKSFPAMLLVFGTGINMHHPLKRRKLMLMQRKDEWEGGSPDDFALYGHGASISFREKRAQIIRDAAPTLPEETVLHLVTATRGLKRSDIQFAVLQFLVTGQMPVPPLHPTNTCDPDTGSWTERLMSIAEYQACFHEAKYIMKFETGFYNQFQSGVKGFMMRIANGLVPFGGRYLAPFLTFIARPV